MSRAAAANAKKADQKAAIADKNAERDLQKSLGLTNAIRPQIKADTLLCMVCGATALGPLTKCTCPGGRTAPKPGSDNLDPENLPCLLAACKARAAQKLDAAQEENLRKQGAVSGQRAKKRDAAGQGASGDADLEVQAISGVEMEQVVEFPIGKLGMDIANNGIVCKVGSVEDGSAAGELGVTPGWLIIQVNDVPVLPKKQHIIKAITAVFKSNKPCGLKFRVPVTEGAHWYCPKCDKFVEVEKFNEETAEKPFGERICAECEEFADMF